jgi:hypothetical protein
MALKIGVKCRLYFCTDGIAGAPAWVLASGVKEVTATIDKGETDVSTRGSGGWKAVVGTLKELTLEFEMPWDPEDVGLQAFKDAFLNDTIIGLAAMDGDIEAAGAEGPWADCAILKFERKEPIGEAAAVSITAKPTFSANPPEWKVIGA